MDTDCSTGAREDDPESSKFENNCSISSCQLSNIHNLVENGFCPYITHVVFCLRQVP